MPLTFTNNTFTASFQNSTDILRQSRLGDSSVAANALQRNVQSLAAQNATRTQTNTAVTAGSESGTQSGARSFAQDTVAINFSGLQSRVGELQGKAAASASTLAAIKKSAENTNGIAERLEQIQAITETATSGTLSRAERSLLQAQVDQLRTEIDGIASGGGGMNYSIVPDQVTNIIIQPNITTSQTSSTTATAQLNFTNNLAANQTVRINGVAFTAVTTTNSGTNFKIGTTLQQTIDNLVTQLRANTSVNLTKASYNRSGNSLVITSDTPGFAGNQFVIDRAASTASANFNVAGDLVGTERYSLQGGVSGDVSSNDVIGTSTGAQVDQLLVAQNVTPSVVRLNFASNTNIANNQTLSLDNGVGGTLAFTFKTAPIAGNLQDIKIGTSLEDTIQNAVAALDRFKQQYTGVNDYAIRQMNFRREGTSLVIESISPGAIFDTAVTGTVDIAETTAGTLSATRLNTGTTAGIDTSGVVNSDFVGTIGGFTATYVSANRVNLSVTVGSRTYTGQVTNTNVTANTVVRLESTTAGGGYFDVQLAANKGNAVANQTQANAYANRMTAAFSTVRFTQDRTINSTNSVELDATFQLRDSNLVAPRKLEAVNVVSKTASGTSNAYFNLTINGEVFQTATNVIGASIGANETFTLTSLTNPYKSVTMRNGATEINLNTNAEAAAFKSKLEKSFGLSIQNNVVVSYKAVETPTANGSNLQGNGVTTNNLFVNKPIDLSSVASSKTANTTANAAVNTFKKAQSFVQRQVSNAENEVKYYENAATTLKGAESSLKEAFAANAGGASPLANGVNTIASDVLQGTTQASLLQSTTQSLQQIGADKPAPKADVEPPVQKNTARAEDDRDQEVTKKQQKPDVDEEEDDQKKSAESEDDSTDETNASPTTKLPSLQQRQAPFSAFANATQSGPNPAGSLFDTTA